MSSQTPANRVVSAELVPLSELSFDPENPRLPRALDSSDEAEVLDWMLKYETITELMASIGAQGFFAAEALLVIPNPVGGYWVVEGNRRLAAAKLLADPRLARSRAASVREIAEEAEHRPTELPVIKYNDRSEILHYLGFRHVTGVKAWDPLAKARYLNQMRAQMVLDGVQVRDMNRTLAKLIGSRADYVAKLLAGLSIYDRIIDEVLSRQDVQVDESDISFSVLTTALSYTNIMAFLGLDRGQPVEEAPPDRLAELTRWIFEKSRDGRTRLGESRNLGLLAKVVADSVALEKFREGEPIKDAAVYAEGASILMRASLGAALSNLRAAYSAAQTVTDLDRADLERAQEVRTASNRLVVVIELFLTNQEAAGDGNHEPR